MAIMVDILLVAVEDTSPRTAMADILLTTARPVVDIPLMSEMADILLTVAVADILLM
jgi:hypothetical protein